MKPKTYRAKSMPEALSLVLRDLGPGATLLKARHVPAGLWGRIAGRFQVEVTAANGVQAPSRVHSESVAAGV